MDAAIQLHQDVCLMTSNLDVLDQYALSLQGTASDRSLVLSKFVLGGGGGSVAIGHVYILRMVLLPGVVYCTWNGSDGIVVLEFVYYVWDGLCQ